MQLVAIGLWVLLLITLKLTGIIAWSWLGVGAASILLVVVVILIISIVS